MSSTSSRTPSGLQDGTWNLHEAALHGSSHYDLPRCLRWFTANIGVHHVHHLCSRIPFYRLPRVLRDHPDLRRHRAADAGCKASGVCGSCCGTKASNVSSLSARCASFVFQLEGRPAHRRCVAPCFDMFGPQDGCGDRRHAAQAERSPLPTRLPSWVGRAPDNPRVKGHHVVELPPDKASSTCPECGTEMVITRITPILFGGKFEDLTLACRTCDFTKKVRIERI